MEYPLAWDLCRELHGRNIQELIKPKELDAPLEESDLHNENLFRYDNLSENNDLPGGDNSSGVDELPAAECYSLEKDQPPSNEHQTLFERLTYPLPVYDDEVKDFPKSVSIDIIKLPVRESPCCKLARLPCELQESILRLLDFESLGSLRCTNYALKMMVESSPAFADMTSYASNTLRAFKNKGLSTFHSAGKLHTALKSQNCAACGRFAPYLFLFTCERSCFFCLHTREQFAMITSKSVDDIFSRASAVGLPSVPYQEYAGRRRHRPQCYSVKQIHEAFLRIYKKPIVYYNPILPHMVHDYIKYGGMELYRTRLLHSKSDESLASFPIYLKAIPMPHLSFSPEPHLEHGLYCSTCRLSYYKDESYLNFELKFGLQVENSLYNNLYSSAVQICNYSNKEIAYSKDGFLAHLQLHCNAEFSWSAFQQYYELLAMLLRTAKNLTLCIRFRGQQSIRSGHIGFQLLLINAINTLLERIRTVDQIPDPDSPFHLTLTDSSRYYINPPR